MAESFLSAEKQSGVFYSRSRLGQSFEYTVKFIHETT